MIRQDLIFNETDFGQVADPEVNTTEAIEVDVNEEASLPDREHQRPQRQRRPPVRYGQDECQVQESKSLEEALQIEHTKQWKAAVDSEYNSLMMNKTWKLVEPPIDRGVIGCKWVFKVKYDNDGKINRFKGRLVAKGYAQEYGIDYD